MKIQINNFLPIVDFNRNIDKTIFISSQARSGSTFFANLLNYRKDFRILFEPLSKAHVEKAKAINLPWYLNEGNTDIKYMEFMSDIIKGTISNRWIDRENKAGFYTKRLIKEVRSNLLLPWIIHNFPDIKVILLLRNPIAVIESWKRLKFEDGFKLRDLILGQHDFVDTIPKPILEAYTSEDDSFLLSLYYWCFCNSFPLKQCRPEDLLCVKYEDLVDKNPLVIDDLFKFTGIDIKNLGDEHYAKVSSSSKFEKRGQHPRLENSKDQIGEQTLLEAQRILDLFEMGHLYNLTLRN